MLFEQSVGKNVPHHGVNRPCCIIGNDIYSCVFITYSSLKVAHESGSVYEKMSAVYSAYDNTGALINLLQMVYHNVKHYFQMQIDMQDVNQVLASHFNDFGQKVIEAYIRPLKIKDSVLKYRVPIQSVLRNWAEDDALLLAMANAALQDKRGDTMEKCRADLLRKIFWIDERYDNMEHDYLDEIDAQVRRYTRAATQKVENLTNRDQNVCGNLNSLLTALSRNRRAAIAAYVQGWLGDADIRYSKDLGIRDDKGYIMSLLAVLTSGEPAAWYQIQELGGAFNENGYSIPQMQICRKEKKK